MPEIFSMDVETSSTVDLTSRGADAYSRDVSTRALMCAYHLNKSASPGRLWLEGDPVPPEWIWHVNNGGMFSGWNVNFFDRLIYARVFVARWGFPPVHDDAWIDSMHKASAANLPRSLAACGSFIGMAFDADKKDQTRLRRITSQLKTPIPATVSDILNGRAPEAAKQKTTAKLTLLDDLTWLADRCRQDIVMEEDLFNRLPEWPQVEPWLGMPAIDRRINDRGILLDVELINGLIEAARKETARLDDDLRKLTNDAVQKTSNVEELKHWLIGRGVTLPSNLKPPDDDAPELDEDEIKEQEKANARKSPWKLRKSDLADLLARPDLAEDCQLAIAIRTEASKVSVRKFRTMIAMASPDGYLRNSMTIGGAQQTLRWASRGANLYNTVRDAFGNFDEIEDLHGVSLKTDPETAKQLQDEELHEAIMIGRRGDPDEIRDRYQRVRKDSQGRPQTLGVLTWISRMTRRTLAAPQGSMMVNGDFAQVEARITDWLAQQIDMLQAYVNDEDVYRVLAANIYKELMEQLTKTKRQAGKVAKLACGFGGGVDALISMGYNYGLMMTQETASEIVQGYRDSNKALVKYWYATDDAAANAVKYPGHEFPVAPLGLVSYKMQDDCLFCRLPSGRMLRYWQPRLTQEYWKNADGSRGQPKNRLSLSGIAIKGKNIFRRPLYHTILMENQVQATGADMLATGLANMERQNIPVVLHVYDSAAAVVPIDRVAETLPIFQTAMEQQPAWTLGLPTRADIEVSARFG